MADGRRAECGLFKFVGGEDFQLIRGPDDRAVALAIHEIDFSVGGDRRDLDVGAEEPFLPMRLASFKVKARGEAVISNRKKFAGVDDRRGAVG